MSTEQYAEAASYLKDELSSEWQRKTALESRGLAAITANVAIVALFFSLATRSSLDLQVNQGKASGYTVAALVIMAVSTIFALSSVAPANYAAPSNEALRGFVDRVLDGSVNVQLVYEETLRSRLRQIQIARRKNTLKATLFFVAVTALAVGTSLFTAALLRAR